MEDPRFMLLSPEAFGPDPKKQLIACVEPLRLLPRGSTGIEIPKGASTVYFDVPETATILTSVHNRIEISGEIEKCSNTAANPQTWEPADADDAKKILLSPNFIAHAFSQFKVQCGHRDTKTHGFIEHGQALYEDFVLSHTKEDVKAANFTWDSKDPANFTPLKKAGWTYLPAAGTANDYSKAFNLIYAANAFKVSYRPLTFPFWLGGKTTPEYGPPSFVIPPLQTQITLAFELDSPYSNVFATSAVAPVGYRLKLTEMELHLQKARLTALGERALKERQRNNLLLYPGTTVCQYPAYMSGTGGVINLEGVECPSHVLIQSFDSGVLSSGTPTTKVYAQAQDPSIGEIALKFENREFYISRVNQLDVEDKDTAALRRREFYHYPFFDMPVDPKIAKGDIADYRHPHVLLSLLSNPLTREKMQTINPNPPDPKRGKLTIELKGKRGGNLQPLYIITLIYQDQGVILDRTNKIFVSSVLMP
jgi:hypothetical protein